MNLLIEDIITLTQINIGERPETLVNTEEVIMEVKKLLEQRIIESGAQLTIGELIDIRAHKNQLILLLQHLISNIMKFNWSNQPLVTIACEIINLPDDNSLQAKSGNYYLLSIKHNGYGFKKIDPYAIFDGVEKRNEENNKNSAIDFVLATKVMEAHAGFLLIEENNDGNSIVKCYFPVR